MSSDLSANNIGNIISSKESNSEKPNIHDYSTTRATQRQFYHEILRMGRNVRGNK